METKKTYWKDVLKKINNNLEIKDISIDFNNEKVEFKDVALLNRYGIEVPEEFIYYDDEKIDFSDDLDITDEDFETGKLIWNLKTSLPLDKELKEWIIREKIDINKLIVKLVKNFYETVKDFPKKAAL